MQNNPVSYVDFAKVARKNHWLSHPVYGDPSFDTFKRHPQNPIHRGVTNLEWPVNGFIFPDPLSGNWYLYVGHYPEGYSILGKEKLTCTVFRSEDAGGTWEHLGPIFDSKEFCFAGDSTPANHAPDVSVVYADGRYHMTYDWLLDDCANLDDVFSGKSGIGYAWSEKPEGPFHRHHEPLLRNDVPAGNPILGKYSRIYATTLIRRANDWLTLSIMDSRDYHAWGLVGMVSDRPEGPYIDMVPIFHVEGNGYQPPLMEYFPAFVHKGWIYSPAIAVALNRDFQVIHRAQLEDALNPDAWQLFQHGSVWHGTNQENEASGIWGQAFSGFVDGKNQFHVMFPSRDTNNKGTINLASRPWTHPYSESGFNISGHHGPSLALLKVFFDDFILNSEFELNGTACFFWANTAPLGPNTPTSDATLHELSRPVGSGLRLSRDRWELVSRMEGQVENVLASGDLPEASKRILRIQRHNDGRICLTLNARQVWEGVLNTGAGSIGVLVEKHSSLTVERFDVGGPAYPATLTLLHTEALLGAGQNRADWQETVSSLFRYGVGAVSKAEGGRAKWNIAGSGITVWSPKGPEFGVVKIMVDNFEYTVNLFAESPLPSQPVFNIDGLPDDFHAVTLKSDNCKLVVDSLDVRCSVPGEKDTQTRRIERCGA